MRKYRCKECDTWHEEAIKTPRGRFCSDKCLFEYIGKVREKDRQKALKRAERDKKKLHAEQKRALKDNDKRYRTKMAEKAFNAFIRERDKELGCVSCELNPSDDNLLTGSKWDCGHFKAKGAHPELRFEELNAAKQCVRCNRDRSGNISNYRVELVKRIGIEKVEWLEGPHEPKKYTCEELKEIELYYKQKLKLLQKQRGN